MNTTWMSGNTTAREEASCETRTIQRSELATKFDERYPLPRYGTWEKAGPLPWEGQRQWAQRFFFISVDKKQGREGGRDKAPSKRSSRRSECLSCLEQTGPVTPQAQEQQQSNILNSPCPSKRQSKLERSLVYSRNLHPVSV